MGKALAVKTGKRQDLAKAKDYRAELKKYAVADAAREPAGGMGNMISIRGKNFTFRGEALPEPLKVVVVDYGFENAYYTSDFDPESPQPPACFAIGKTEDGLAPHETSPRPQAETCAECPHNQFGSADKGRGKACKNNRRLMLINADVSELDDKYIKGADVAMMRLPPTSVKHFKGHLKKVTEGIGLPIFAVVTKMTFEEDAATPVVIPQFEEEIADDRKLMNALIDKRDDVQTQLLTPPDASGYQDPGEKPRKGVKPAPVKVKPAPVKGKVARSKF